jgi:hypothetical protein
MCHIDCFGRDSFAKEESKNKKDGEEQEQELWRRYPLEGGSLSKEVCLRNNCSTLACCLAESRV